MRKLAFAFAAACAAIITPATIAPASADVYVTPPPVYVYPRPLRPWRYRYYAPAPAYYAPVPVAPVCTTRVVRVWVDGRYVSRRVNRCY